MNGKVQSYFKKAIAAGVAATAMMTMAAPAEASRWWVRGKTLYYSGTTQANDAVSLRLWLQRQRAAGNPIDTIVFRNAPGGVATGGLQMGDLIQQEGLRTVFQGGCYSACAAAFSGGATRGMAAFNLPTVYAIYDRNTLGYHGASLGGRPVPTAQQLQFYDYIANYLLGSDITPEARERLRLAHVGLQDSQGFLRYLDPQVTTGSSVIFCPTGSWSTTGDLTGCTQYQGANIYTDGILNIPGYVEVNDILQLTTSFTGDLNPNWRGLGDQYGLITIANNGVYNVNTRTSAVQTWIQNGGTMNILTGGRYGENAQTIIESGGRINLQGGMLSTFRDVIDVARYLNTGDRGYEEGTVALFRKGSTLSGSGRVAGNIYMNGTFAPTNMVLSAYVNQNELADTEYGGIQLGATSTTQITVSPQTQRAALRNERAAVYATNFVSTGNLIQATLMYLNAPVLIKQGASLEVNFERGFYRAGQVVPLMDSFANPNIPTTIPTGCTFSCTRPGTAPIENPLRLPMYNGKFTNFIRGNDGAIIALDPAKLSQLIQVGNDSLLGFDLVYTAAADIPGLTIGGTKYTEDYIGNFTSLSLVARPAFDDTSVFANKASGDGLGQALKAASYSDTPRIESLLGALQFSSRSAAQAASGTLRGDAYATQAFGDQALTGALDDFHFGRLADLRAGRDQLARSFTADIAQAGSSADSLANQSGDMLRYLVDGPQEPQVTRPADGTWRGWGQMLIGKARTDAGLGVAALDSEYRGVVIGADRGVRGGNGLVGASVSYLSGDNETAGDSYKNNVEVVSGTIYGTFEHSRGAVTGSARLSRLSHEATRRVSGIGGLEFPVEGDYDSTDAAISVESVIDGKDFRGASIRFFAPTFSYQRTEGAEVSETGGALRLSVDGENLESARLGIGGEISRLVRTKAGTMTPHLRLGYERELADITTSVNNSFVDRPDLPFIARSQELGRDIGRVDAGVTLVDDGQFAATIQYQGRFRDGQDQHGGFVGVSYRF